jgi:hypothetical protein
LDNIGGESNAGCIVAHKMTHAAYGIAVIWGNGNPPHEYSSRSGTRIDLMTYGDVEPWPGNPDVLAVNINGKEIEQGLMMKICGDVAILLGREEEWRRKQPDLDTYLRNPPNIEDLLQF